MNLFTKSGECTILSRIGQNCPIVIERGLYIAITTITSAAAVLHSNTQGSIVSLQIVSSAVSFT